MLTDEQRDKAIKDFASSIAVGHRCSLPECTRCEAVRQIAAALALSPMPLVEGRGVGIHV